MENKNQVKQSSSKKGKNPQGTLAAPGPSHKVERFYTCLRNIKVNICLLCKWHLIKAQALAPCTSWTPVSICSSLCTLTLCFRYYKPLGVLWVYRTLLHLCVPWVHLLSIRLILCLLNSSDYLSTSIWRSHWSNWAQIIVFFSNHHSILCTF